VKEVRVDEIIRLLVQTRVEFVVVGMTAGVLQGGPTTTIDLIATLDEILGRQR
jgi:hypothetical protein